MDRERKAKFKATIFEAIKLHQEGEPALEKYLNEGIVKDFNPSDYTNLNSAPKFRLKTLIEDYGILIETYERLKPPFPSSFRAETIKLLDEILVLISIPDSSA
jgi:hypothetical protein